MNREPNPPPAEPPTLEQRILQAEQRLLARQHRVQRRWQALAARWQRATAPRRWVWPLLGLGLSALTAGRLLRHRAAAPSEPPPERPWLRLLVLGWPLAERLWRHRPPASAASAPSTPSAPTGASAASAASAVTAAKAAVPPR
ncbi:MAG: hypothetical protein KGJ24_10850 [Burkholderiales bacterium]|nr:hypothetical protein [Burkholderiales bacterium]MDE2567120.1 hypothetical protein [Burkholderiales bacterium]